MKIQFNDVYQNNNKYYQQILDIINYRKQNKLKKLSVSKRDENYIYCEVHHIIPKSWYKFHNLPIDNSSDNKILLTAKEHILIHILMKKYFDSIGNKHMFYAMTDAFLKMLNGNKELAIEIEKDKSFIDKILPDILNAKKQLSIMRSISNKKYWNNLSETELTEQKSRRAESSKKFWQNLSSTEYNSMCKKFSNAQKNRSVEQKNEIRQKISTALKEYYKNLSDEEKEKQSIVKSNISRNIWKNRSIKDKNKISKKISMSLKLNLNLSNIRKNVWENMSDDIKENRRRKIIESNKNTWKNLSKEELNNRKNRMSIAKRGRKWMSNDQLKHAIQVKSDEFNLYLKNGYVFGDHRNKWK